jgi:hypothetical protein
MTYRSQTRRKARPGVVLAIVVVTLIVVSLTVAASVRLIADGHVQVKFAEQRQQARWFARAAIDRAVQSLHKATDYSGEEWEIPADFMPSKIAHQALIVVNRDQANPSRANILVTIFAQHGEAKQVLCQTQQSIPLPGPGGST